MEEGKLHLFRCTGGGENPNNFREELCVDRCTQGLRRQDDWFSSIDTAVQFKVASGAGSHQFCGILF